MKRIVRNVAAVLAAVLVSGLFGCAVDTTWTHKAGDEVMPAGVYISILMDSFLDGVNYLQEVEDSKVLTAELLGLDDTPETRVSDKEPSEILKMSAYGVTSVEWMTDKATSYVQQYFAVITESARRGLELSEEQRNENAATATQMMIDYKTYFERNGISESSVLMSLNNETAKQNLFMNIYGKGGEKEVPEQEIEDNFSESMTKMQMMYIPKSVVETEEETDAETDEDQNAEEREEAEAYLERLKAGESIEDLNYEYELSHAAEEDKESIQKMEPGSMDMLVPQSYEQYFGEELMAKLKAVEVGECVMAEDEYSFYVAKRLDTLEELEEYRESVLKDLRWEEYEAMLQEVGAALDITANDAAIRRYTLQNLKF